MSKITFTEEIITPHIAQTYLDTMARNRRVTKSSIDRYTHDMRSGKWIENTGEAIKFSEDGHLRDGMHRLKSIIAANVSLSMLVMRGISKDAYEVLDTGVSRTGADVFRINGIKYDTLLPALIVNYNCIKETGKMNFGNSSFKEVRSKNTNAAILNQYQTDPLFWDFIAKETMSFYTSFSKMLSPSFIGGFYAITYKMNPDLATSFMRQLCIGEMTSYNVNLFRNKIINDRTSGTRSMKVNVKLALIIKTWNYFIKKNKVKSLRYDPAKEEFPKISRPI